MFLFGQRTGRKGEISLSPILTLTHLHTNANRDLPGEIMGGSNSLPSPSKHQRFGGLSTRKPPRRITKESFSDWPELGSWWVVCTM